MPYTHRLEDDLTDMIHTLQESLQSQKIERCSFNITVEKNIIKYDQSSKKRILALKKKKIQIHISRFIIPSTLPLFPLKHMLSHQPASLCCGTAVTCQSVTSLGASYSASQKNTQTPDDWRTLSHEISNHTGSDGTYHFSLAWVVCRHCTMTTLASFTASNEKSKCTCICAAT